MGKKLLGHSIGDSPPVVAYRQDPQKEGYHASDIPLLIDLGLLEKKEGKIQRTQAYQALLPQDFAVFFNWALGSRRYPLPEIVRDIFCRRWGQLQASADSHASAIATRPELRHLASEIRTMLETDGIRGDIQDLEQCRKSMSGGTPMGGTCEPGCQQQIDAMREELGALKTRLDAFKQVEQPPVGNTTKIQEEIADLKRDVGKLQSTNKNTVISSLSAPALSASASNHSTAPSNTASNTGSNLSPSQNMGDSAQARLNSSLQQKNPLFSKQTMKNRFQKLGAFTRKAASTTKDALGTGVKGTIGALGTAASTTKDALETGVKGTMGALETAATKTKEALGTAAKGTIGALTKMSPFAPNIKTNDNFFDFENSNASSKTPRPLHYMNNSKPIPSTFMKGTRKFAKNKLNRTRNFFRRPSYPTPTSTANERLAAPLQQQNPMKRKILPIRNIGLRQQPAQTIQPESSQSTSGTLGNSTETKRGVFGIAANKTRKLASGIKGAFTRKQNKELQQPQSPQTQEPQDVGQTFSNPLFQRRTDVIRNPLATLPPAATQQPASTEDNTVQTISALRKTAEVPQPKSYQPPQLPGSVGNQVPFQPPSGTRPQELKRPNRSILPKQHSIVGQNAVYGNPSVAPPVVPGSLQKLATGQIGGSRKRKPRRRHRRTQRR